MPESLSLYVLLILAIGAGFMLGKRDKRKQELAPKLLPKEYFQGLNYLLNDQEDLAIDTFIKSMTVNDETLETHLALGNMVRRQGEIDRAIRIHQNLLAHTGLSSSKRALTEIELARDYLSAGLLDRAETLLTELAAENGKLKNVARTMLLDIYQREREWPKAIEIIRLLVKKNFWDLGEQPDAVRLRNTLAHFLCEQAEIEFQNNDYTETRRLLEQAEAVDATNARVSLARAALEIQQKNFSQAQKHLRKVLRQNPALIPETLVLYQEACRALNTESAYFDYLEACLQCELHLEVLAELAVMHQVQKGEENAVRFIVEQVVGKPSMAGMGFLFETLDKNSTVLTLELQSSILSAFQGLVRQHTNFRCNSCGFSASKLIWHCPSCKLWGGINRMVSVPGKP